MEGTLPSLIKTILTLSLILALGQTISTDNACTFHQGGKLFTFVYLQQSTPSQYQIDDNTTIYYNFCSAFVPAVCPSGTKTAYTFLVTESTSTDTSNLTTTTYTCTRYSSNSYSSLFSATYTTDQQQTSYLTYTQLTQINQSVSTSGDRRKTITILQCGSEVQDFQLQSANATDSVIYLVGESMYGCPVLEISSIWSVFSDNWLVIGGILCVMGVHLLFFGRVTIETTIFIASFLICFAIVGAVFTVFVGPNSSTFVIYFAFLLLLFLATMMAYGVTKLVGVSIFFVGAILGFMIGMLVNSIFCSIFDIYSVWSLVIFQILFTIPFGLLTFKYQDEIIIASSSLTGSYFIVRPISWIFGGFPNQFTLYSLFQAQQLSGIPWTFYVYLIFIIALAIVGAMYQLIKLHREDPNQQIQVNFIQESIQQPIDLIKQKVDKLIERFRSDNDADDYRKVSELKDAQPLRKSEPHSVDSENLKKSDYF